MVISHSPALSWSDFPQFGTAAVTAEIKSSHWQETQECWSCGHTNRSSLLLSPPRSEKSKSVRVREWSGYVRSDGVWHADAKKWVGEEWEAVRTTPGATYSRKTGSVIEPATSGGEFQNTDVTRRKKEMYRWFNNSIKFINDKLEYYYIKAPAFLDRY